MNIFGAVTVLFALILAGCASPQPTSAETASSTGPTETEKEMEPVRTLELTSGLQVLTPEVGPFMRVLAKFTYRGPAFAFEATLKDPQGNELPLSEFGNIYDDWDDGDFSATHSNTGDWFTSIANRSVLLDIHLPEEAPEGNWSLVALKETLHGSDLSSLGNQTWFRFSRSFQPSFAIAWESYEDQANRYATPHMAETIDLFPTANGTAIAGHCLTYKSRDVYCFPAHAPPLGCNGIILHLVNRSESVYRHTPDFLGDCIHNATANETDNGQAMTEEPLVIELGHAKRMLFSHFEPVVLRGPSGRLRSVVYPA
ncbi:MAG TPA: hypothetical protein VM327_04905 [Candidatus Thermoplasmatota archaeon]|nr:hypothetical protein [Candidatus Thermoplasmatota archaeon]